jgi:hypothetical protein
MPLPIAAKSRNRRYWVLATRELSDPTRWMLSARASHDGCIRNRCSNVKLGWRKCEKPLRHKRNLILQNADFWDFGCGQSKNALK